MKSPEFKNRIDRRSFFSRSTCASLGLTSLVNTLAHLQVIDAFAAGQAITSYKALVCIFLRGGLDTNNLLIPRGTHPQAANYTRDRGVIAIGNGAAPAGNPVPPDNTLPVNPANAAAGEQFGLHPACGNMASMFNAGELAFVANVGNLAEPIPSPVAFANSLKPVQLFSHSDQMTEWMAGSRPQDPFTSGWGGRVADVVNAQNSLSRGSMLITVAGNNDFLVAPGGSVPQYSVTTSGATALSGFGVNYADALNPDGSYKNNSFGRRLEAFEKIMNFSHDHIIEEGYNTIVRRARATEAIIGEASTIAAGAGIDHDAIWAAYGASGNLANQLKMVARLIAGRKCLGNERQIFFVDLASFDSHQEQNGDLQKLLGQVDKSIGAFNQAMKDFAASSHPDLVDFNYEDVLSFEASDFNRTWTPNGADPAGSGTDHAWGTHVFAFGGPLAQKHGGGAGKLDGQFPELTVGGPDDVPEGGRGRWIPTTAVDQYCAVIAEWFGVAPGDLDTVFPNRQSFETDRIAANLDFLPGLV